MHRLPPLNALRVFEVAARTGSYAEAGAELGLTHGAVSRQIAALETWLGQRLFIRFGPTYDGNTGRARASLLRSAFPLTA